MGTSAARRAPTTRLWRLAKGAATRYLSPARRWGGHGRGGGWPGIWRPWGRGTRGRWRPCASPGRWPRIWGLWRRWPHPRGGKGPLTAWGLGELVGGLPGRAALGVSGALVGAAAGWRRPWPGLPWPRVLMTAGRLGPQRPAARVEPGQLVRAFWPRPAPQAGPGPGGAAGGGRRPVTGAPERPGRRCKRWIDGRLRPRPPGARRPGGLARPAGWTWVTEVTAERLLIRLRPDFIIRSYQ